MAAEAGVMVAPVAPEPDSSSLAPAPDVNVLIPTLRRPAELARALRSVLAQHGGASHIAAVVVVDNSPEGSARPVVEALSSTTALRIVYVHEPRPGVATARNAGLAACHAPLVAFLDDDEEAPPQWLERLRRAHLELGATVTFGPVAGVATGADPVLRPYLDGFFSRQPGCETGLIEDHYGCGNAIMTRASALQGPEPFARSADRTGGEDDRLFDELRAKGARFGWAADAEVLEYALPQRATVRYALKRAFCYGQSPTQSAARRRLPHLVLFWMGVGAGQAVVYGAVAVAHAVVGRKLAAVRMLDRAVRGMGKLIWPFEVPLYGLPQPEMRTRVRAEAVTGNAAAPSAPG